MCCTKTREKNKTWDPGHRGLRQKGKEKSQDDNEGKAQNNSCAIGLVSNS